MKNEIDNKNYEDYSKKVFIGSFWNSWDKRLFKKCGDRKYKGNFMPDIVKNSLLRYTKKGDLVVDCFAGSGTTIDVCKIYDRKCFALDLNPVREDIVEGNAQIFNFPKCKHVIMHPPYTSVIKYSEKEEDLSNVWDEKNNTQNFDLFLERLDNVIKNITKSLEKGGFITFVIGDIFTKGEYIPLHSMCFELFKKNGYIPKAICVKNCADIRNNNKNYKLWLYRTLKYGLYFWQHEYIMFFKKER
ncbi:MAG: DNA methyltransferase [Candidatus Heimdallarchaeaceae archaeon]